MTKPLPPKHSPKEFFDKLKHYEEAHHLPPFIVISLRNFFHSYAAALQDNHLHIEDYIPLFLDYLDLVKAQVENPYTFEPYHKMIKAPYDHHRLGIEFFKALVHLDKSSLSGLEYLQEIQEHIRNKHNVVLLANHQIEPDPQALYIFFEKFAQDLIPATIFVAGERVILDPLAVPFSLGCNLLCIYSKRYIDHPPEKKEQKQMHNQKTMKLMKSLLDEGGHCIYVAPSGGRDRPDENGVVTPAPFDPQSVEMFHLMANHASKKTFFYPLALKTYDLMPPPEKIQRELGEHRTTKATPIHITFGKVIDMDNFPGSELTDKLARRQAKASYIHSLVCAAYATSN